MAWILIGCRFDLVSQHGQRLHEDLQLDLYDVADWTLVGLLAISGADAARIPAQFLGGHQRITGSFFIFSFFEPNKFGGQREKSIAAT